MEKGLLNQATLKIQLILGMIGVGTIVTKHGRGKTILYNLKGMAGLIRRAISGINIKVIAIEGKVLLKCSTGMGLFGNSKGYCSSRNIIMNINFI